MTADQPGLVAPVGRRLVSAFANGRRACARAMDHWPVRLLVVLTGIVMCDATVRFVGNHMTIHAYHQSNDEYETFLDWCRISLWFLRGFFVALFFARYLPRPAVIFLRTFSCVSYAIFLAAHFPAPAAELWEYREVPAAAPALVLASLPRYIEYSFPHLGIYSPLVLPLSLLLRHIISILSVAFLYEIAFGSRKDESSNGV